MSQFIRYQDYLELNTLIDLQKTRAQPAEHDEYLFITIHQVYELWFKQLITELDHLLVCLDKQQIDKVVHTLGRMLKIFKTMVGQVDILETMTPMEFTSFRAFLDSASGFQSYQFRELEIMLGIRNPKKWKQFQQDDIIFKKLEKRANTPSLWDKTLQFLNINGTNTEERHLALIEIYHQNTQLRNYLERLVDLDEGLQEWRYRHVKMVERTIGHKMGTGGSMGAAYLKTTLFTPVFPDLWNIRDRL